MMLSVIIPVIVGFAVTLFITPWAKKFLERIGIVGRDVQKKEKPVMATSAGIPVSIGFITSILTYVFITTFITKAGTNLTILFASLTSILTIVLLLLLDDINIQPLQKTSKGEMDTRIGLKQWQKVLISFLGAVPLMVLQAGHSTVAVPFLGIINLGYLYPLLIIPLTIVFTSNASNMLAGMNGLSAGLGLVLLSFTGIYSLLYGGVEGAILSLGMAGCLVAFLKFNAYPAKFLPGDTLTYMIGVVFGTSLIVGNIEKFGLIAYALWFVEFFLKARKKFKASSLGILQKDGTLRPKYKKIYSLTQIGMKIVKKEKYIAPFFMTIETIICIAAFVIARATA